MVERPVERPEWAARQGTDAVAIDQGLRAYMLGVYNYMAAGLAITGAVAYALSLMLVGADGQPTELMRALFLSPLKWVVIFAPLVVVFLMSARLHRMSLGTAQATFWGFAALMGISLSTIFLVYSGMSIASTFFMTAAGFGALSLYGYTTKRDLSPIGSFLIIGLVGLIIASVVNLFLQSSGMSFAISVIGVLIFAGLTAYDTQAIKEWYNAGDDTAVMGRKSILGALRLYLDFINLFMFLLQFLGNRR